MKYIVVMVTTPNRKTSLRLAKLLLDRRLVACVNLIPGLMSLYRWKGRLEKSREELLLLKTRASKWAALEKAVRLAHPYETCEILALPVGRGSAPYLRWLYDSLSPR